MPINTVPIRCAVWGTGHMGVELTRAAVRRGDVHPVAAIVTDPAKAGRDLGEIAGLDRRLDAPATLDADAVLARDDIDVVFFCGIAGSNEIAAALARIVRAGKEAVTFSGLAHPPTAIGVAAARELDRVARDAGHRILSTGLAPGLMIDVLPVALAACCVDWDSISVRVVAPMDDWGDLLLDAYGIGKPPGGHADTASRLSFLESVGMMADALGVDIAESSESFEAMVAEQRLAGRRTIDPGLSRGARRRFSATTGTGQTLSIEMLIVYLLDETRDGLREECTIEITGGPSSGVKATLSGGWSPDPYPATAACGLNALPGLLSLPPGLYNAAQVPFAAPRADPPSAAVKM